MELLQNITWVGENPPQDVEAYYKTITSTGITFFSFDVHCGIPGVTVTGMFFELPENNTIPLNVENAPLSSTIVVGSAGVGTNNIITKQALCQLYKAADGSIKISVTFDPIHLTDVSGSLIYHTI